MKTVKNLFSQITELKNIYKAFKEAAKGKKWKPYVDQFKANLEKELFQLQEDLVSKNYQPGDYYNFYITEEREIKKRNEHSKKNNVPLGTKCL